MPDKNKKLTVFLVVAASTTLAAAPLFTAKMKEMESHYLRMQTLVQGEQRSSADVTLSPKTTKGLEESLASMAEISKALEKTPLSRGMQFNAQAQQFRREIEGLRKRITKANVLEAQQIISETAISCGNCHSCRAHE